MDRLIIVAASIVVCVSAGCGKTTCGTNDFECIMDHSTFAVNGITVRPVKLPASRVPAPAPTMTSAMAPSSNAMPISIIPMSAPNFGDPIQMIQAGEPSQPGGDAVGVPAATITMAPTSVMLTVDEPVKIMSIGYSDPYGMTPSFVFLPDIGTPVCWAFPPIRDLQDQGVAHIEIDAGNVQMKPVAPSAPAPVVVMPPPVDPTPLDPNVGPSVITATPVVSWFQPPLEPTDFTNNVGNGTINGNGNGNGGTPGIGIYTECAGAGLIACNSKSPPVCNSSQTCCSSNGQCVICVPDCSHPLHQWGPCYASACTSQINDAVNYCCPAAP